MVRRERSSEGPRHWSYLELGSHAETPAPDGPVTVMCGHGQRAMTGASIITARGHRDVSVLDGGPDARDAWSGKQLVVAP